MIIGNKAYIGVTNQGVVITANDPDPSFATDSFYIEEADIPKLIKFLQSVGGDKLVSYGGNFPYGLQARVGHPHESEKNYEEIATIDTICQAYKVGDSLRVIARELNYRGIRNRAGNDWHHWQIKRILIRAGLI